MDHCSAKNLEFEDHHLKLSDLVGLIIRRNELANDILVASTTQQLPPMLRADGGNTESSGLADLFDAHVSHLSTLHFKFIRHWNRLIDLEAREMKLPRKDIAHPHGSKGRDAASHLSSMVLDMKDGFQHHSSHKDSRFIYRFVRQNLSESRERVPIEDTTRNGSTAADDLDCKLRTGDRVILRTEVSHLTVANGIIAEISRTHVSVSLSKRLRLPWSEPSSEMSNLSNESWRIYKDEYMTSFSVMRFNLMQLFIQSVHTIGIRKMIVDLEPPRFDNGSILSQDPAISYIWSEKSLNNDQRQAILKILTAKDYALILGMPGTGKTSTMVHAVKALLIRGSSILLASYTNSAVDNLLIKLKAQGIEFLRIGRDEAVHEEVRESCFSAMDMCSVDDIKTKLDQVKVVASTCLGINSPYLVNRRFDVCIIDEAGQIALPVSIGPLLFASTFVLVGDHYQLPPLVQSTEARENGMGISLFRRLSEAHPQAISMLQNQYRMCRGIMELSNALIYGDRLCCGSAEVANATLESEIVKEPRMVGNDELKASYGAKELGQPKKGVTDFMEDLNPANDLKPTHNLDTPTAMEFPGDKGFTNGMTSANGVTYPAVVQLEKRDGQKINASDEHKLVKDIEEMKVKVKALESKLQQADSTISKLMEERSIGSQHRESLQQELADLRTKKIVKEKHVGFPLLYVCVVAFINIVIGYGLRT
ncbi:hypothetical protein F2Q69_00063658 [Brassica cretica]|uniref:DNA replication ATP-dependent helicase/nuclease n=1 Tax=Brassica cretica TaxID=69181 RepID=A0A8S9RBK2_BRACR|nr:hypothetical protein F2Q69_00063658 [Brassica cretica]